MIPLFSGFLRCVFVIYLITAESVYVQLKLESVMHNALERLLEVDKGEDF